MGVAVGDYDNSGRLSLFVTNFAEEYNALYRNEGAYFTDRSFRSKTAASSLPYVGWGTALFDYDNDGLLDIIVVNGHVYPQLDQARLGASAPLPPAAAALPQQRRRHLRGGGRALRRGAHRAARVARPGDDRPRRRRARRPRAERPRRLPAGAPATSSSRSATGCGSSSRARAEHGAPSARSCRVKAGGLSMQRLVQERIELHLAGRQAPALRPRAEREGRLGRGAVAGPDEDARRERRGRPGAEDQEALTAPAVHSTLKSMSREAVALARLSITTTLSA